MSAGNQGSYRVYEGLRMARNHAPDCGRNLYWPSGRALAYAPAEVVSADSPCNLGEKRRVFHKLLRSYAVVVNDAGIRMNIPSTVETAVTLGLGVELVQ